MPAAGQDSALLLQTCSAGSLPVLVAGAVGRGLREGELCPTLSIVQSSRVSSRTERVSIHLLMCFEDVCGRNLLF